MPGIPPSSNVSGAIEACVDAIYELVMHDSGYDPYRSRMLAAGLVGASQVNARYWIDAHRPVEKDVAVETTVAAAVGRPVTFRIRTSRRPTDPGGCLASDRYLEPKPTRRTSALPTSA